MRITSPRCRISPTEARPVVASWSCPVIPRETAANPPLPASPLHPYKSPTRLKSSFLKHSRAAAPDPPGGNHSPRNPLTPACSPGASHLGKQAGNSRGSREIRPSGAWVSGHASRFRGGLVSARAARDTRPPRTGVQGHDALPGGAGGGAPRILILPVRTPGRTRRPRGAGSRPVEEVAQGVVVELRGDVRVLAHGVGERGLFVQQRMAIFWTSL